MTIRAAGPGDATVAFQPTRRVLWVPLASIWLLVAASFSVPGRTGSESLDSLDALALFKAGVRGLVVGALMLAILTLGRNAGQRAARRGFAPFSIFVLWALTSSLWSPLPAFSVGQVMTLCAQFLLAVTLALAWRSGDDTSIVLGHLAAAFLVICFALVGVHAVNPQLSGLNRASEESGLFHPITSGATASLGLVLVLSARLIWGWRWTRVLLVPSLVVFPTVLYLSASRMALALAIVLAALLVCLGDRRRLAALALAGTLVGIVYPLADPGLDAARRAAGATAEYVRRGDSVETLQSLTGRTELWSVLLESFLDAPLIGHGYLVTSKEARVEVWNTLENRGAHNLFLQVAVSTGLVGLGLFLVGLWRPITVAGRQLGSTAEGRRLRRLAAILGVWYVGWSALNESFMGGLAPESILAFALLGLMAGHNEPETA